MSVKLLMPGYLLEKLVLSGYIKLLEKLWNKSKIRKVFGEESLVGF